MVKSVLVLLAPGFEEVDGALITSRGPGTAMEFAFKLVELLYGNEKVEEVNAGVMARL